jgi:hypothetical protein
LHSSSSIPGGTLLGPLSGIWEARHSSTAGIESPRSTARTEPMLYSPVSAISLLVPPGMRRSVVDASMFGGVVPVGVRRVLAVRRALLCGFVQGESQRGSWFVSE